ncbi:protein DBF4 homolog A isoform X1 [Sinocyclocheilus rhinocerous]|uniref:Protein DBF4 homolog A n=2 Tax=Sinocyclocheilus rhinocerous TaxID=307959 RepID=A0A673N1P6_9TELE|nr:PREDICTED: protein DBF4 homolog A-like isoform X1 [Sinocyclocheilus rhinocerous]
MMKHESFSKCKDRDSKLDGHNSATSKSKIKPTCDALQNKLFKGRIFYLDLPWNMKTQLLENDIKTLGGTVEKFFSKEIKYLVSGKPEARYAQRLLPDSPAPSPDSGVSSPHPSSRRESHGHRGSSQGVTDTTAVSRGKSLVERVVKEQERVQMNGILANAVEWGVKVLHVDDVISYVDKRKSKIIAVNSANPVVKGAASIQHTEKNLYHRHNAGRIRRPFVKVEDSSRHYRPIYLPLSNMPVCNVRSLPPCSPFLMDERGKDDPKKRHKEQRSGGERGAQGKKERRRGHEGREKRKGGYCECCEVKFDNLKVHLESKQHQAFSKSDVYRVVDRVTAGLTCDLINIGTHCRRAKCSTSTPVLCAGAMLPVKEDVGSVNGGWIQESEGSLLWSSTAKLPLSEQTREKPLSVRKRSRGQCEFPQSNRDSLFNQSDIPEKSQSKRGSFEWEFHSRKSEAASLLGRELNCDSNALECRTDQQTRTNPDMHTAQQFSERDIESLTGIECFRTNCCEVYSQSMPENQVGNSALWPLACKEPEPDLDSPTNSLQRKVRSVRSRRRKQAPALHIESSKERESLSSLSPVKPVQECENPPASLLDLWQLFQSSDNMDKDFKGF